MNKVENRLGVAATTAAAVVLGATANASENQDYREQKALPAPIEMQGVSPFESSAVLNGTSAVLVYPNSSLWESRFAEPKDQPKEELEVFKFLLNKFVDTGAESDYWKDFKSKLNGEDSERYFTKSELTLGNNFLPDARYYSYFPEGVDTNQEQIPNVTIAVLDPTHSPEYSTTVVVQMRLGSDGTLKGYSEEPVDEEDLKFFSREQLAEQLADNFKNKKSEEAEIETYSRNGANVATLQYVDKAGLRREAIALGNGYMQFRVDFPQH